MSAIKKSSNLQQSHLDYLLLAFSKSSDIDEVKQSFQIFFETGISGEVLMEVLRDHKDRVIELKSALSFEDKTKGIRIADPVHQLELLDSLHDKCLEERTVNITREGEHVTKIDTATAARCIELSSRIRLGEKHLELEKAKLALLKEGGSSTDGEVATKVNPGRPQIRIFHAREEDDGLQEEA